MATLLTTSYQLISSVKSSTYSMFRLYGKYDEQNIETNKTTITLQTRIYGNGGSGSFDSGTSKINSTSKSLTSVSYTKGKETVLQTLTYEVEHNSTGTYENKTVTASLTTSYNQSGNISTTISLPTIPRASTYSTSNSFPNIGGNVTIAINRKNDNFVHDLSWKTADEQLSGVIATKTTDTSIVWTIPEEIYDLIPNASRITIRLLLTTFSVDDENNYTQIGDIYGEDGGVIATVNSELYKPIVDYTITETNEKIISVTDNLVLNASMPKFNITAEGQKGATISSIVVSNEDGQSYSGQEVTFKEIGTSKFTITVTDSRGIPNIISLDLSTQDIDYIKPNIKKIELERKGPTSGEIILNASGDFYNGEFSVESGKNILDIYYRYKENVSDATFSEMILLPSESISFDSNSYTITDYDLGNITEYNKNYVFEFYCSDSLTEISTAITRTVRKGIDVFSLGEHDAKVNGNLFVADEDGLNKVNVLEKINNLLIPETIDNITVNLSGMTIAKNGSFKLGNMVFLALTLRGVTMNDANTILCTVPVKPIVSESPLICNVYGSNVSQNVGYIALDGTIHVRFATALSNVEIRIIGCYLTN